MPVVTDAEILECDYRRMPPDARKLIGLSDEQYKASPFAVFAEPVVKPSFVRRLVARRLFAEI